MIGQPTAGLGYELEAIAAVVIGGGSLPGGEGSVWARSSARLSSGCSQTAATCWASVRIGSK